MAESLETSSNRRPRHSFTRVVSAIFVVLFLSNTPHTLAYRQTAQQQWTDKTTLYSDPDGVMLGNTGRNRQGMGSKKISPGDKKLLDQALDAFQQASSLEKELQKSEGAVSAQTKELKSELAKAKATAKSTGQTKYFRREERLDKELMRQAESETRRDKRLVDQADSEMRDDKQFLQQAYGIDDIGAYQARREAKTKSAASDCNYQLCHQAKDLGIAPDSCVIGAGACVLRALSTSMLNDHVG
jgi:hypothetical protein